MRPFPAFEIAHANLVIGARTGLARHVHDDCAADQSVEWNLVGGPCALGEMHRRVEMRAAVLGSAEIVGRIVVALVGRPVGHLFELELLRCRPEDRSVIERMGQVDDPHARQQLAVVFRHLGSCDQGDGREGHQHQATSGATHLSDSSDWKGLDCSDPAYGRRTLARVRRRDALHAALQRPYQIIWMDGSSVQTHRPEVIDALRTQRLACVIGDGEARNEPAPVSDCIIAVP